MAGLKVKRGQLALAFLCLVATDFVVRVIQGDPLTTTRGFVAWGTALVVALIVFASAVIAGTRRSL